MKYKIVKNPDIDLNIPKFHCDGNSVGEHLNEHPLTALLNVYGFLCVIGRPGQGKTSLTVSLLTQSKPRIYKKTAHHNIIVMPTNSINSLHKNPFKDLENIYGELNDEVITDIYNKVDEWSQNDEKSILYIDDMTSDLKKSKTIIETLKKMIYNRRHLKLNIIITAQSYVNIPLDVRKNIQNMILFKPSKKEMELIFNELIETKKDDFEDVMKMAYTDKHNFLFLNVPSSRMFINWDELVFTEENENDELEVKTIPG